MGNGIEYVHEEALGGRRSGVPGEERFACVRVASFRSYAAWMGMEAWQEALERSLMTPAPCFMCAEQLPWRCRRHLIADLLVARGSEVVHLLAPAAKLEHRPFEGTEAQDGRLYICGSLVA
jgi:uncharacterized protein (DUF488 family)